jgi:hypothetical protein
MIHVARPEAVPVSVCEVTLRGQVILGACREKEKA